MKSSPPFSKHTFRSCLRKATLALCLVSGALLTSCGDHQEQVESVALPEISVETKEVGIAEIPVFAEVVGTVRPRKEARVASKVTGRLLEMTAIPGKRVAEGDVLARIEVGELEAALDRAQAALTQAERDFARYQSVSNQGLSRKQISNRQNQDKKWRQPLSP